MRVSNKSVWLILVTGLEIVSKLYYSFVVVIESSPDQKSPLISTRRPVDRPSEGPQAYTANAP